MWWIDSIEVSVEGDQLVPGLELVKVLGMSGTLEHQPDGGTGELDIGCVCVCVCVCVRQTDRQTQGSRERLQQDFSVEQLQWQDCHLLGWGGELELDFGHIKSLAVSTLRWLFFLFIYYLFIYLFLRWLFNIWRSQGLVWKTETIMATSRRISTYKKCFNTKLNFLYIPTE